MEGNSPDVRVCVWQKATCVCVNKDGGERMKLQQLHTLYVRIPSVYADKINVRSFELLIAKLWRGEESQVGGRM